MPNPTNQRPQNFISPIIDAARTRTSWIAQPQPILRSVDSLAPAHLACGGLWPSAPSARALRCSLPSVKNSSAQLFRHACRRGKRQFASETEGYEHRNQSL
jgi:hypothetical protein